MWRPGSDCDVAAGVWRLGYDVALVVVCCAEDAVRANAVMIGYGSRTVEWWKLNGQLRHMLEMVGRFALEYSRISLRSAWGKKAVLDVFSRYIFETLYK